MIRANLLPRPKESLTAFGLEVDTEYLRHAVIGFAVVVLVALAGIAFERFTVAHLQAQAADEEAAIAADAPHRSEAKLLANDVARYQEFAREERRYRSSGAEAAIAVAQIGNRVPETVWLDGITSSENGYDLAGGARSIDAVSGVIFALGYALPQVDASLVDVENKPSEGIAFNARVSSRGR